MTADANIGAAAVGLLVSQRSHLLMVLSAAKDGMEQAFEVWFTGAFRKAIAGTEGLLDTRLYRQHEVDLTAGRHAPITYGWLALLDLSLDGGEMADALIRQIARLHAESSIATRPATWLYYPVGEPVGRRTPDAPMMTVAYANPIPGMEGIFREFYVTRHIRHALNVPALVSGQCLERAQYQSPGSSQPIFQTVALYEQIDEPSAIIDAFATLPPGTLDFPSLEKLRGRFSECTYRRLSNGAKPPIATR